MKQTTERQFICITETNGNKCVIPLKRLICVNFVINSVQVLSEGMQSKVCQFKSVEERDAAVTYF
jgi:hypothetical protein